jgi:hypothetical protein
MAIDGVWIDELDFLIPYTHQLELQANYSAIANLHILLITAAPTKSFSACCLYQS